MEKDAYIAEVLAKYPQFHDPDAVIKLKARGLFALIGQAWDEGNDHAFEDPMPLPPEFESIFGKFRK